MRAREKRGVREPVKICILYSGTRMMFSPDRFQLANLYGYARSYHKLKYQILPPTFLYKRNRLVCCGNTR